MTFPHIGNPFGVYFCVATIVGFFAIGLIAQHFEDRN